MSHTISVQELLGRDRGCVVVMTLKISVIEKRVLKTMILAVVKGGPQTCCHLMKVISRAVMKQ